MMGCTAAARCGRTKRADCWTTRHRNFHERCALATKKQTYRFLITTQQSFAQALACVFDTPLSVGFDAGGSRLARGREKACLTGPRTSPSGQGTSRPHAASTKGRFPRRTVRGFSPPLLPPTGVAPRLWRRTGWTPWRFSATGVSGCTLGCGVLAQVVLMIGILAAFSLVLCGMVTWEVLSKFWFDFSILSGRRKFKWPMVSDFISCAETEALTFYRSCTLFVGYA